MPIQFENRTNQGGFTLTKNANGGGFDIIQVSGPIAPSPTPSITPSISVTPSVTVSVTPSITVSATPSISITPSVSISATPSISVTPSVTVTQTPSISITPSITVSTTPSISVTPSVSITGTPAPTVTPSISITGTPAPTVTPSVSRTPSVSVSSTPAPTVTPSVSRTPSVTPSISITPSITPSTAISTYALNTSSGNWVKSGNVSWLQNVTQNSSFTLSYWVNFKTTSGFLTPRYVFHSLDSSSTTFFSNNIAVRYNDIGYSGMTFFMSSQSSGNTSEVMSFGEINYPNAWYHFAIVYDGSAKTITIKRNNTTIVNAQSFGTTLSMTTTNARNIAFAGLGGAISSNNGTDIYLDEFGWFSRVLSDAEITTIYNNRYQYDLSNISELTELWKYDNNLNSKNGTANLSAIGFPSYIVAPNPTY